MNPQPIQFVHRGRVVAVSDAPPTRTLLDWLREDAHCTGTKEGCNEGDCGACTVVIGELEADASGTGQALALRSVNACIQFLPTLHGKALFTVEDLKPTQAAGPVQVLHPVQQAMVECHGSQCGFCTPGFVMSLWACYQQHLAQGTRPTRQQLADALSGNLCRCTGYRPILDAGQRMFDLPSSPLDAPALALILRALQGSTGGLHFEGRNAQGQPQHFDAPRTLEQLALLREQKPQAQLLAGCTDIGLWVNKQLRELGDILYIGDVAELKRIEERADELYIGAGASLEAAYSALVARLPSVADVWLRFASPPIRHAGTLGGNVANGSPIGDSAPLLMALDAHVQLRRGQAVRRLPLHQFYLGYMKNQLQAGEFLEGVAIPLAALGRAVRAYKISKRFDCDISALCAGLSIALDGNGHVASVRLAFGGMAATVQRAAQAEAALLGQPWSQASVHAAQQALAQDFAPLSDLRASASYRMQVAQNLMQRFWLETRPNDPLPPQASSVWSVMPHQLPAAPPAPVPTPMG